MSKRDLSAVAKYMGYAALVIVLALAVVGCVSVPLGHAEGVIKKSKSKVKQAQAQPEPWVPSPYTPPIDSPPEMASNWYVGVVGGYAWTPIEDTWSGGIVGGWLWRYGSFGAGVEADYVVRDLGSFTLEDAMASVRARAGVFFGATFVYGTAGISQYMGDLAPDGFDRGLVVGGGIERDIAKGLALRLEGLHYRHTDDYLGWGDHGSTVARLGLIAKF